jgi:hypothetical protein
MTFRKLAAALKISVATAHKIAKAGCPTDSVEEAKAWLKDRAANLQTNATAATLTEKRGRKLDLECSLLAIRVEREASNAEFLPVPEVLDALANFMRFAHIALRMRCDAFAERVTASSTPQEVAKALRELTDESWATSAVAMAGQVQSTRMARAIADLILERFSRATAELFKQ